jgi:uncharacterized protein YcbK (DUF882 family)
MTSKYFKIAEYDCQCKNAQCEGKGVELDSKLLAIMDKIREKYGAPVSVTSGWRCPDHNKAVGGAANSTHMSGKGVDITAPDIEKLYKICLEQAGLTGIGDGRKKGFIHIDVKPSKVIRKWLY